MDEYKSRSHKYWAAHKEVWYEKLNRLDSNIQKRIWNNPHCREGRKLGNDTHKRVTFILAGASSNKN